MSVIDDALKKTQQKLNASSKAVVMTKTKTSFLLMTIALIVGAVGVLSLFNNLTHHNKKHLSLVVVPKKSVVKIAVKEVPVPQLTLNGTMIGGSNSIAMINHHAYHIGDSVDGMNIQSISAKSVQLQQGQKKIDLSS